MKNLGATYRIGGVYMIENHKNGKRFIGSSFDVEWYRKHTIKLLEAGTHPIKELQRDYDAHHRMSFSLLYAEIVPKYQGNWGQRRKLLDLASDYVLKYKTIENGYNRYGSRHIRRKAPDALPSEAGQ